MRVFHILDSLGVGGLENGVINLVNRLDPKTFEHVICALRKTGPMVARIQRKGVPVICLERKSREPLIALRLSRLMRKFAPHIVHTRNWGAIDGIIAARLCGIRAVIHGEHGREYGDLSGASVRRNIVRRVLTLGVCRFVAVSEELAVWLREVVKVPSDKTVLIRNGVDTDIFRPAADRCQAKASIGLDPEKVIIGTVGRLDKVKNYAGLLRALTHFEESNPRYVMVFVGDGPERENLERFSAQAGLNNVVFCGEREDVPLYLRAFDIFVLPSLGEGMSNTILEAMATGLPVVATKVGGNSEMIEEGKTGVLVEPNNEAMLRRKLEDYLKWKTLREDVGRRSRAVCQDRFSINRMVMSYADLYSGVLQSE